MWWQYVDTNAKNYGQAPGFQAGVIALRPVDPLDGLVYFATDTQSITRYQSGAWVTYGSGSGTTPTLQQVTSAGNTTTNVVVINNPQGIVVQDSGAQARFFTGTNGVTIDDQTWGGGSIRIFSNGISFLTGAGLPVNFENWQGLSSAGAIIKNSTGVLVATFGAANTTNASIVGSLDVGDILTNTSGGIRTTAQQGFLLRNDANSANLGGLVRKRWITGSGVDDSPAIFAETGYTLAFYIDGSISKGLNIGLSGAPTFTSISGSYSVFVTNDTTAANNAGGGFYNLANSTAANRLAAIWLDADGGNFAGSDYGIIEKIGSGGKLRIMNYNATGIALGTAGNEYVIMDGGTGALTLNNDLLALTKIRGFGGASFGGTLANGEYQFYGSSTLGLVIAGAGSSNAITITNNAGSVIVTVSSAGAGVFVSTLQATQFNAVQAAGSSLAGTMTGTGTNIGSQFKFVNDYNATGAFIGIAAGETTGDAVFAVGASKKLVFAAGSTGTERIGEFTANSLRIFSVAGNTSNYVQLGAEASITATWLFGTRVSGASVSLDTTQYLFATVNGVQVKIATVI